MLLGNAEGSPVLTPVGLLGKVLGEGAGLRLMLAAGLALAESCTGPCTGPECVSH